MTKKLNSIEFVSFYKVRNSNGEVTLQMELLFVIVISRFLKRYLIAKRTRVHQLIHERCDESKGVPKGGVERSSSPITRIPGGDRVAVKVDVIQMEKVNRIRWVPLSLSY